MGRRNVPESIFLPSPLDTRDRTLNQSIIDLYRILARRLNAEITAGATAEIPTADGSSRFFWDETTNKLYFDEGTWVEVGAAGAPGAGVVPIGGIIMWSGTIAAIPATWALCDGTANTPGPDLRDKFVVGAKQDDAGIAKTNVRGSLEQSATATGHSHSGHANLTHAGGAVADHTGLTHSLTISNHPDLTHAALSHAASSFTHADHSIASQSHVHAASTITQAAHASAVDISIPSHAVTMPSHASLTVASHSHANPTHTHATVAYSKGGTASNIMPATSATIPGPSFTSLGASITSWTGTAAAVSGSRPSLGHADISLASFSGTQSAVTHTHADHSFPSLSHQAIGTHVGTDYGVHAFTAPAAHGAAGTLSHAFTQPSEHAISAHDTVSMVPSFFALAFIQRMS